MAEGFHGGTSPAKDDGCFDVCLIDERPRLDQGRRGWLPGRALIGRRQRADPVPYGTVRQYATMPHWAAEHRRPDAPCSPPRAVIG